MTEQSAPFFLVIVDHDQGFFSVEGPMTDDRPWKGRGLECPQQSAAH